MNLKPSLQPQNINPEFWYYEDKRSLEFYMDKLPSGKLGRIRASTMLKSLSRIYGVDFSKYIKQE